MEEGSPEPWTTQLVPKEPNPYYYTTYDDYAIAMERWVALCNNTIIIPPHATQLEYMIPIQSNKTIEQERKARKQKNKESPTEENINLEELIKKDDLKSGLIYIPFFPPLPSTRSTESSNKKDLEKKDPDSHFHPERGPDIAQPWFVKGSKEHESVRFNVRKFIIELLATRVATHKATSFFNRPFLPTIHGTFSPKSTPQAFEKYIPKPLRRTDLTELALESCYDCPEEINSQPVNFDVPILSVEPLQLSCLFGEKHNEWNLSGTSITGFTPHQPASDHYVYYGDDSFSKIHPKTLTYSEQMKEDYVAEKISEWQRKKEESRNDELNAWYFPTTPKQVFLHHQAQVEAIIAETPIGSAKFTIEQIERMLLVPVFLDNFKDSLSNEVHQQKADSGLPSSFLQYLEASVDVDNFPLLLSCYPNHSSNRLFVAKLSCFVQELLQSSNGRDLLDEIISEKDVPSLSYVAFAMSFFRLTALDIFPFDHELYHLIFETCEGLSLFGTFRDPSVEGIIKGIFIVYYLNIIGLAIHENSYAYLSLGTRYIPAAIHLAIHELGQLLSQNPHNFMSVVFKHCKHRSSKISSFFFFLLIQIISISNHSDVVKEYLQSKEADLVNNVRSLAKSRFSHVQYAARIMFDIISGRAWGHLVSEAYSTSPDLLLADLQTPNYYRKPSLLSSLVLSMFIRDLQEKQTQLTEVSTEESGERGNAGALSKFLVSSSNYWSSLIKEIFSQISDLSLTTVTYSSLFAEICKTLSLCNALSVDKPRRDEGEVSGIVKITTAEINGILDFIFQVPSSHSYAYPVKTNMLLALKHLLKAPGSFPTLLGVKEYNIYPRLITFCQDGENAEFNKAAWSSFYTIIRYHTGVVDYLIKQNMLFTFMEIISPISGNVIIFNGLHYICKIFSMLENEYIRTSQGFSLTHLDSRDTRDIEKDMKHLNKFFTERRMFIKFHMIYKRFTEGHEDNLSFNVSPPFLELVKFYQAINECIGCEKLKRDILKQTEYQKGFVTVLDMVGENYIVKTKPDGTIELESTYKTMKIPSTFGQGTNTVTTPRKKKSRSVLGRDKMKASKRKNSKEKQKFWKKNKHK